jgi:hypothetical protein
MSIIAITATDKGLTSYVISTFNRFDNKINVELSHDREKAKDFNTESAAAEILRKIYNPYERSYSIEKIKFSPNQKTVITRTQSWIEEKVLK